LQRIRLKKSEIRGNVKYTVRNVLATTSEQWRPVNNGQPKSSQTSFNNNFDWKTSKEQPPLYNGHFLGVPKGGVCKHIYTHWMLLQFLYYTYLKRFCWAYGMAKLFNSKAFIKSNEMYLKSQYSKTYILPFASRLTAQSFFVYKSH